MEGPLVLDIEFLQDRLRTNLNYEGTTSDRYVLADLRSHLWIKSNNSVLPAGPYAINLYLFTLAQGVYSHRNVLAASSPRPPGWFVDGCHGTSEKLHPGT